MTMRSSKKKGKRCAEARLDRIGEISEKLGEVIADAIDDVAKNKKYSDGGVDFKTLKEAASALCTLADSVKAVSAVGGTEEKSVPGLTVMFGDDERMAE